MGVFFVVLIACGCVIFICVYLFRRKDDHQIVKGITTVESIKSMSLEDVESMLRNIEKQKAPKAASFAMCYMQAIPSDKAEYICPVCGQKTVYSSRNGCFVNENLDAARRRFAELKETSALMMELDESSFCKKCNPEARKPFFVLKITYSDGSWYEYKDIMPSDLALLVDFFKGGLIYHGDFGSERPLKKRLKHLRKLLGLKKGYCKMTEKMETE